MGFTHVCSPPVLADPWSERVPTGCGHTNTFSYVVPNLCSQARQWPLFLSQAPASRFIPLFMNDSHADRSNTHLVLCVLCHGTDFPRGRQGRHMPCHMSRMEIVRHARTTGPNESWHNTPVLTALGYFFLDSLLRTV